jgi:GT2 family glycosyltransferase
MTLGMVKAFPSVFVILVNWNREDDTIECVDSLRACRYGNQRIVVVDNGSTENSVARLRALGDDMVLLEMGDNLGFTGGNNIGIEHAMRHGADYVFLLNNDTVLDPGCIGRLVETAEEDPAIGVVGPKIVFYDRPRVIWAAGGEYRAGWVTGRATGQGQTDVGQFDVRRDVAWVTGCAMLIRRQVIGQQGGLCDDFFAVGEDLDYCLATRKGGYRVVYEPRALVRHKESMSSGGHDAPQYVYYQTRNFVLLRWRWSKGGWRTVGAHVYALAFFLFRAARLCGRLRPRAALGVYLGARDGWRNVRGRREYPILKTDWSGARPRPG